MSEDLEIEKALQRLMPRGLGEEACLDLEQTIDRLAEEVEDEVRPLPQWKRAAAVLAIGALGSAVFFLAGEQDTRVAQWDAGELEPEFEVVEQTVWLEEGRDEGLRAMNEAGDALRAWTYQAVEEERVRDLESGYMVTLQREFDGELYLTTSL